MLSLFIGSDPGAIRGQTLERSPGLDSSSGSSSMIEAEEQAEVIIAPANGFLNDVMIEQTTMEAIRLPSLKSTS